MTFEEARELMQKRKFTLACSKFGIYAFVQVDPEKFPNVVVEVIPERNEFRIIYQNVNSILKIETPWCSPLSDRDHFKRVLGQVKKWARKIGELYEE